MSKIEKAVSLPFKLPGQLLGLLESSAAQRILTGLIRHAATIGGTWLAAQGSLDASTTEQVIGAIVVILSAAASAIEKKAQ